MTATLFIVGTPLGNLGDLSPRAARTLADVDVIAAEDTRRTAKLLNHLGIAKPLVSYWGPKEKAKTRKVLSLLEEGKSVALVSDAGTPGISDPGRIVVAEAAERGFPIVAVPGPSAVATALSVSGLDGDRFLFAGFLPAKRGARRRVIEELAIEPGSVVFYEAPHRIIESLSDLSEVFGPHRKVVVLRELTKLHEETFRGMLEEVLEMVADSTVAGEYVIITEGRRREGTGTIAEALREMTHLMRHGTSRKNAAAQIAKDYGISKKKLYDASLVPGAGEESPT